MESVHVYLPEQQYAGCSKYTLSHEFGTYKYMAGSPERMNAPNRTELLESSVVSLVSTG